MGWETRRMDEGSNQVRGTGGGRLLKTKSYEAGGSEGLRGCEGWRGFRRQWPVSNRESKGGPSTSKKKRLRLANALREHSGGGGSPQRPSPQRRAPPVPCFALSHAWWLGLSPPSGAVSTWGTPSPPPQDRAQSLRPLSA